MGFAPNTAHPHPTTPVDISKDEFLSMDDVQTSALPKGQVSVVMNSYDKTIGRPIYWTAKLKFIVKFLLSVSQTINRPRPSKKF